MRKSLLLASALMFGICMNSCDKGSESPKTLVDVTFSESTTIQSHKSADKTRTVVSSSGVTRWAPGDQVTLVDKDEILRQFEYQGTTNRTDGQFKGQLMGGQGSRQYFGFHKPANVPCSMGNGCVLTINHEDLNLTENGGINSEVFGKYCPMVAIPITFDVAEFDKAGGLQFHHATSLIEASVCFTEGHSHWSYSFDKVYFELHADGKDPQFNSKVTIDLTKVKGKPDYEVEIPFEESSEGKKHTISTTLNYTSAKTLAERVSSDIGCFSIPIFALPTEADFHCVATVIFYREGKEVFRLQNDGGFRGLNPAGLNTLDFDEGHIVVPIN